MEIFRFYSLMVLALLILALFSMKKPETILLSTSPVNVMVLYENGGHHLAYTTRAIQWLDQYTQGRNLSIRYLTQTDSINETLLNNTDLFIQLDYPPYGWKPGAAKAFEKYINEGQGGWIGFHHASLLGKFDGYPEWDWFVKFMGNIRFKDYIAGFADASVKAEKNQHPVLKGLPASFPIKREEWYTYDRSPRGNVEVLASVDESTYQPDSDKKMGDHPVIWTNTQYKARNIYIFMGHGPELFDNENYRKIFSNAIEWAAAK